MKGVTKSGFEFEVDERLKGDFRFNLIARRMRNTGSDDAAAAVADSVDLLLGKEGAERLYQHVASLNDGFIPSEAIGDFMREISEYAFNTDALKN